MKTELFKNITSGAEFSEDGKYRYRLWRIWDRGKPLAMCIGLNPSTANGEKNDQTIIHLIKIFKRLGYGGFYMMNCWAFVASKPKDLMRNPMSDEWNNNAISVTAGLCKDIVFAWGNFEIIKETARDKEIIEMFPNALCFGISKNKSPLHPLALMYNGTASTATLHKYSELTSLTP